MKSKDIKYLISISSFLVANSMATAGDMASITFSQDSVFVFSLQGGYSAHNTGKASRYFIGSDSNIFTYANSTITTNTGFIGIGLSAEHALPFEVPRGVFMQSGVEYNYFGSANVKGINRVGIEPETSTVYYYDYHVQTQQILGVIKLFATEYNRFYPYGEVGLGAAFNQASRYHTVAFETGSINITPGFNHYNSVQFSYSLGLGVETQLSMKIRAGLGYRYSDFGTSSLGAGAVSFGHYRYPVLFTLSGLHASTNQLLGRISYNW